MQSSSSGQLLLPSGYCALLSTVLTIDGSLSGRSQSCSAPWVLPLVCWRLRRAARSRARLLRRCLPPDRDRCIAIAAQRQQHPQAQAPSPPPSTAASRRQLGQASRSSASSSTLLPRWSRSSLQQSRAMTTCWWVVVLLPLRLPVPQWCRMNLMFVPAPFLSVPTQHSAASDKLPFSGSKAAAFPCTAHVCGRPEADAPPPPPIPRRRWTSSTLPQTTPTWRPASRR